MYVPLRTGLYVASSLVCLGVGLGGTFADEPSPPTGRLVMTQKEFPCQEDEVLGYSEQFGTDHVGCIHIDGLP